MLIKEYRIPLPLTVEEYRIAQLYMIQKKSRLESTGSGSAVEIIKNVPYENGPGGNGQYTKKIYHIGSHLPGWLKSLLPKTALRVEEEAWNAYPYTKTRHTCPFIDKFFIDIETHYLEDYGQTENVFKLSKSESKHLEIDLIDPIKDNFPNKDYKKEEDPHYFISKKTGRGPLQDNWLADYENGEVTEPIMCAYKLIRVEFKYWGMQSKIEQFIQNGLRNPILVGHRQAWSWQDEWFGLTIDDIRELERQTQIELSKRMVNLTGDTENANHIVVENVSAESESESKGEKEEDSESSSSSDLDLSVNCQKETFNTKTRSSVDQTSGACLQQERLLEIHMKHLEQSDSDNDIDDDDDFYDALESLDNDYYRPTHRNSSAASQETISGVFSPNEMKDNAEAVTSPTLDSFQDLSFSNTKTLVFVIQGGSFINDLDTEAKLKDFETFERVFTTVCHHNYPGLRGGVHFELIDCQSLTNDILDSLKELNIFSHNASEEVNNTTEHLCNSFPFSSMPLLLTQAPNFHINADDMIKQVNEKYNQFMTGFKTEDMNIEIYLLADCVGGLLVYQALRESYNDDTISIASDDRSLSQDSEQFSVDVFTTSSFDFVINGVFSFGSPIGLIAYKDKLSTGKACQPPRCGQMYNLFHPYDPMASRIEPVVDQAFGKIRPAPVPRHQAFPYNNDIQYNYTSLYDDSEAMLHDHELASSKLNSREMERKISTASTCSIQRNSAYNNKSPFVHWWGTKRIDYMLHCPDGLEQFPVSTLMQICYNSYWESKDLVTFILWQILDANHQASKPDKIEQIVSFTNLLPKEKWLKKRTNLKIKNMNPNHRANDIICAAGAQQFISGKFAYGPVDLAALSSEKVDIYIAPKQRMNDWKLLGTDMTDSHGRLFYCTPTRGMEPGIYSLKMVVRGDHSNVSSNMAILPAQTEAVVFSIDGSFLASYSLRGIDPKIRGGAVDVVRHWQDLGYLIIYVSSRLLFQKGQVMSWLSQHNFPFGIIHFCENISTDFQKHKIDFLKNITKYENVSIHAAYGASRDIPVYISALRLNASKVFLIGKKTKSKKADGVQWISDGYAPHLKELKKSNLSKRCTSNKNMFMALGSMGTSRPEGALTRSRDLSVLDEEVEDPKPRSEKGLGHSFIRSIRAKSKSHHHNK